MISTILNICDLPIPAGISGKAFGNPSIPVVSELYKCPSKTMGEWLGEHRIIYDGKYKYMQYERNKNPELFDLENDPGELNNLYEKLPDIASSMERKLKNWKKAHPPRYTTSMQKILPLSQEEREALNALGYIQ